jgi:hypothetical protein
MTTAIESRIEDALNLYVSRRLPAHLRDETPPVLPGIDPDDPFWRELHQRRRNAMLDALAASFYDELVAKLPQGVGLFEVAEGKQPNGQTLWWRSLSAAERQGHREHDRLIEETLVNPQPSRPPPRRGDLPEGYNSLAAMAEATERAANNSQVLLKPSQA